MKRTTGRLVSVVSL